MEDSYALGIDLGGTKVDIALVNQQGCVCEHLHLLTQPQYLPEQIIENILQNAQQLIRQSLKKISAVGIGVAGQIDKTGETVLFAPNLRWHHIPLKKIVENELSLPCLLLNDVRAATWGEWLHGNGKDCQDFICLFIGTGIGGGIISGGQLLQGHANTAGELGHTTLYAGGRLCTCGHQGCLEAYVGGWGIAKTLQAISEKSPEQAQTLLSYVNGNDQTLRAEHLSLALEKKDSYSKKIYEQIIQDLTNGCVTFVNALNPQKLIFGGSVALGLPSLIKHVAEGIKISALKSASQNLTVVPALLGKQAAVIGSAAAALSYFKNKV